MGAPFDHRFHAMKIFRPADRGYQKFLATFSRQHEADPALQQTVRKILAEVEKRGDAALCRLTAKFGGPSLTPADLAVTPAEIVAAQRGLDREAARAIRAARSNVRAFARRGLRKTWFTKNRQGAVVGERFDPFQRVGIYVPGGTAPLVSSAVMTCTLAQAAGVPEIVVMTPAAKDKSVAPALLAALAECGATEVYRVGGAQAVAALAVGTATVRPVQKIFGPGNAYVVEAKRQVFGRVAIDLLPGPSEVLVIADRAANARWIAADLLAQSEHGHGSIAILLTDSERVLSGVEKEIARQVRLSARPRELEAALANAALVLVDRLDTAVSLANRFAAEHVAIATEHPGEVARQLTTSGAIFLGGMSPVAGGDFLAGPSHELPTGGAGRSFAGLTADQFQRRTSVVMFDEPALRKSLPIIETFGRIEGLDAHTRSASVRLERARKRHTV